MSKGAQIAVGGALVALLLGWFAWAQLESGSFTYFQDLSEFRAAGQPGKPARVHGYVAEGSIQRDVEGKTVRFLVQGTPPHAGGAAGEPLPVVYASLETPDLFKDGAEVVVEGRLAGDGDVFHASNLLAKCPSKFEAAAGEAEAGAASL